MDRFSLNFPGLKMYKWQTFVFYMPNALPEVLELQRRVFAVLNEPLYQVLDTCSHGEFLTKTVRVKSTDLDAVVFFDLDCIPLKHGVVEKAVRIAVEQNMVIGCAQQANHIEINLIEQRRNNLPVLLRKLDTARMRFRRFLGQDPYVISNPLIYAGPCFLVIPSKVYQAVGEPTLTVTSRADAAGELTIACHEHSVKVKCLQPTYCHVPKYKLGNTMRFGLGTVYGHCIFHAFETTYLSNHQSASLFKEYCQKVIDQFSVKPVSSVRE